MKKIVSIIIVFILFVSLAIFLNKGNKKDNQKRIVLWHWMTDRDKALQELSRQYKELTGVEIDVELYAPSKVYARKITAAAQAKVLPDIYGILDTKETFANYIKSGLVADLTEEFKKNNSALEKTFFPKALDVNRFKEGNIYDISPGIYGVPLDITIIQMLYNKNLLAKAGFKNPPNNFAEFVTQLKALKRIGINGLVSGWGELWLIDCFALNYAFNIMGEEKIMATFRGEIPYTDPDWITVFGLFKTLKDIGGLAEGIITKENKYAEQDFALERAAFAFNGSWCLNVYNKMNPSLVYSAMLPPAINADKPMMIWGGAGSSFVVNNNSKSKEKAITFLKWLSAKDQQAYLSKETQNLPANKDSLVDIPDVLAGFAKVMDNTTHPTIWKYNENSLVAERFDKGIQSIILGDKTPEQVGQEVQEEKEKQIAREKRRQQRKQNN